MQIKKSIFQSLIILFSGDCYVNLDLDSRHFSFPSYGLYPAQAERVREVFFPGRKCVNKENVNEKKASDPEFAKFFDQLLSHKKTMGKVTTKTYLMQAVTTLTMVLQQKGGGNKIPQSVKDFFIDAV